MHVQCHKWSQLLHNHVTSLFTEHGATGYDSVGWESLTGIILVISPHSTLSGSLASQSAHSPSSMIYPQRVALTLEATSCNSSRCYDNSPSPSHSKTNPVPGITWNSCHSTGLTGLEETPTACGMPLSFIAKCSPPSVLVKLQENLHKGNSTPLGFFIKDLKTPLEVLGPPLRGGDFCGIHSPPTWSQMCSHCSKSARESEVRSTS